jgi:hypothetical protein
MQITFTQLQYWKAVMQLASDIIKGPFISQTEQGIPKQEKYGGMGCQERQQ